MSSKLDAHPGSELASSILIFRKILCEFCVPARNNAAWSQRGTIFALPPYKGRKDRQVESGLINSCRPQQINETTDGSTVRMFDERVNDRDSLELDHAIEMQRREFENISADLERVLDETADAEEEYAHLKIALHAIEEARQSGVIILLNDLLARERNRADSAEKEFSRLIAIRENLLERCSDMRETIQLKKNRIESRKIRALSRYHNVCGELFFVLRDVQTCIGWNNSESLSPPVYINAASIKHSHITRILDKILRVHTTILWIFWLAHPATPSFAGLSLCIRPASTK
jgi:hypothetical protein